MKRAWGGIGSTGNRWLLGLFLCLSPVPVMLQLSAHHVNVAGRASPLRAVGEIRMAGVSGRLDHMAVGPGDGRLYVANADGGRVAVLDRRRSRLIRVLSGFREPQGVAVLPETRRLFVANGGDGIVDILDTTTLQTVRQVPLGADADNIRYDARRGQVLVGYGNGGIAVLSKTGVLLQRVRLPGHPEAFELGANGSRLFANVPEAHCICVVDRDAAKVIATWAVPAGANFPMALDEGHHRLFVGCRRPAGLLVYDTGTGRCTARLPLCDDADDIFFDAPSRRLYVSCGSGEVGVWQQRSADGYTRLDSVPTAPGARTALFVPSERRLYVAIPADGARAAAIRVFTTAK